MKTIIRQGNTEDIWYCKCGACGCLFEATTQDGHFEDAVGSLTHHGYFVRIFVTKCPMTECGIRVLVREDESAKPDWWPIKHKYTKFGLITEVKTESVSEIIQSPDAVVP